MFRVERLSAPSAAYSKAAVDLETFTADRIKQFHRHGPFPRPSLLKCVDVNTGGRVEEVFQFGNERETGYCQQ